MKNRQFAYGIIEGFYGRPWSWEDRDSTLAFMQEHGYEFYIYAPKSDKFLRDQWKDAWPQAEFHRLSIFAQNCKENGIRFGIGLSPLEIYFDFSRQAKNDLKRKIRLINALKPDILSLLFDDMKGDNAKMAALQIDVLNYTMDVSDADSLIMCPTYYTTSSILEKVFGKMPENYFEDIGKLTDPSVDIFWTGEEVCSNEYSETHLKTMTGLLGRKPFIWDNYPVNDGSRLAPFLRLRAFTGRPYRMSEWTAGHAVNPMNQARLSRIPMRSLQDNYVLKTGYSPEAAFVNAIQTLCGGELADCLLEDYEYFNDKGLESMSTEEKAAFIEKYSAFQSPYAREIVDWLEGKYEPAAVPV